jgi:lipoate-protein ligase B
MKVKVSFLGMVEYQTAFSMQQQLAEEVAAGAQLPVLLILEHPHVYTFGRQGDRVNLLWGEEALAQRGISLEESDRGGDVTYHGPGQLVGYPILPLGEMGTLEYLRKLEVVIIHMLAGYGITGVQVPGQTGVWVPAMDQNTPQAKIASIGVRVDANRVTRHGFALNISPDMSYWQGIIACGLENQAKTSLAQLLPEAPSMVNVVKKLLDAFAFVFDCQIELDEPPPI